MHVVSSLCLQIPPRALSCIDIAGIGEETLRGIAKRVQVMLAEGRTIVLIDSGGQTRTGAVKDPIA